MIRRTLGGLSRGRLRWVLGLFAAALALPAAVLVVHAYGQLKWEAFHQARALAEELAGRIDQRLVELIGSEERRGFADYQFLVVRGGSDASFLQPSPLAEFPPRSSFPGLLGYFQVDPNGVFSTPLLPPRPETAGRYGIERSELEERSRAEARIRQVLADNRLVSYRANRRDQGRGKEAPMTRELGDADSAVAAPEQRVDAGASTARETEYQAAFDELKRSVQRPARKKEAGEQSEDLRALLRSAPYPDLDARHLTDDADVKARPRAPVRGARKELSQLAESPPAAAPGMASAELERAPRITTFESELDPFELSLLDDRHLVLYRKVWRDGKRYVQGAVIEHDSFLDGLVGQAFRDSSVSGFSSLVSTWRGHVSAFHSGRPGTRGASRSMTEALSGELLYRTRLSAPASDLELVFSVTRIPAGPGAKVVVWMATALAAVLAGGVLLMYRLGCREIDIVEQQRDFVAAVSHELRTPLTSIRMYGELLREGWASEEKKRSYYDFILQESERLSRLISNVLQLARMTRNDARVELKELTTGELMDGIHSKVTTQAEQAGFELAFDLPPRLAAVSLNVDPDGFSQIFINLVDNAIKFSARSPRKRIEILARESRAGAAITFAVRDHGPGVARDQMRKIFSLFYRTENELTRETVGTGIGLSLVRELAGAMRASVEVRNVEPGAEFSVTFPARAA